MFKDNWPFKPILNEYTSPEHLIEGETSIFICLIMIKTTCENLEIAGQ